MRYDLSNALHLQQFKARCEAFIRNAATVELAEKKPRRTLPQNALYHIWIKVFAEAIGETDLAAVDLDVKRHLLGMRSRLSRISGQWTPTDYRTSEMSKEEMTAFMDRFKHFAQTEYGCYLPYEREEGFREMIAEYL